MAMGMAHSRRSCTAERPSRPLQTEQKYKKRYRKRERLLNFKHHILNADLNVEGDGEASQWQAYGKYLQIKVSSSVLYGQQLEVCHSDRAPDLRALLTDSCALAWLSSKHRWQARRATKPDLSTKHTGSAAVFQKIFYFFIYFFIFLIKRARGGLSVPAQTTDRDDGRRQKKTPKSEQHSESG